MLALCGVLYGLGAEDVAVPAYEEFPEALGFQFGEISGTGLSYQIWTPALGIQIAGGIIYAPLNGGWPSRTLDYTIGAEFQFPVYGEDFASWLSGRLYLVTGLSHAGYIPVVVATDGYERTDSTWVEPVFAAGEFTPVLGVGAGIGIEMILFRHFSIPLELGYGVKWEPTAGALSSQFNVNLHVQAGFRYRY